MAEKKKTSGKPKKPTKTQTKKVISTAKKTAKKVKKLPKGQRIAITILVVLLIAALVFAGIYFRKEIMGWFQPPEGNGGGTTQTQDGRFAVEGFQNTQFYGTAPLLSDETAQIYFVNVGQGSSLFMIFDDGTTFLADAGCTAVKGYVTKSVAETNLVNLLNSLKISAIDYVMATHPDADHVNLLAKLFDNYQINCTVYNDIPEKDTTATYNTFREKALAEPNSQQMKIGETGFLEDYDNDGSKTTETVTGGETSLTMYAPGYNNRAEGFASHKNDKNSMSPICILSYGGRKLLFTGDSTTTTEEWFIRFTAKETAAKFDVDVLFVGHHGSESSTSSEFLAFIKPEYAVISAGAGNSYEHPRAATMERLKSRGVVTYRTDTHGTIKLLFDNASEFGFSPETRAYTFNNTNKVSDRMMS